MDHFPKIGVKIKHVWVATTQFHIYVYLQKKHIQLVFLPHRPHWCDSPSPRFFFIKIVQLKSWFFARYNIAFSFGGYGVGQTCWFQRSLIDTIFWNIQRLERDIKLNNKTKRVSKITRVYQVIGWPICSICIYKYITWLYVMIFSHPFQKAKNMETQKKSRRLLTSPTVPKFNREISLGKKTLLATRQNLGL